MKQKLLKFERHTLRRYTDIHSYGSITKTLLFEKRIIGAIMPAALTEFSDAAAEITKIEQEGLRIVNYKKMYTPAENHINMYDIVLENNSITQYKVIKVYDYKKYGKLGKHTKVILAELS